MPQQQCTNLELSQELINLIEEEYPVGSTFSNDYSGTLGLVVGYYKDRMVVEKENTITLYYISAYQLAEMNIWIRKIVIKYLLKNNLIEL